MEESSRFLCILAALNNYNRTIKILEKKKITFLVQVLQKEGVKLPSCALHQRSRASMAGRKPPHQPREKSWALDAGTKQQEGLAN